MFGGNLRQLGVKVNDAPMVGSCKMPWQTGRLQPVRAVVPKCRWFCSWGVSGRKDL